MSKLIIFGAGKIGELFCNEEASGLLDLFSDIYLYDNDKKKQKRFLYGYYVLTAEEILKLLDEDDVKIIIATTKWREVISDSIIVKHLDKVQAVYTFSTYDNIKSIEYNNNLDLLQRSGSKKFLEGVPLFDCINRVAIMLSNLCNYACFHKACPAYSVKQKEIMPSKIVYKILDELGENNFNGEVCFHLYNEPLMDPRLFSFIQYSKQKMPNVDVHIYSNGYYLNDTMVKELEMVGVTRITTTAYTENEWRRLTSLEVNVAFHVLRGKLDQRVELYKDREDMSCNIMCMSYFEQVPIYVNGDIGTCCLDWKHTYKLGNVTNETLKEIVNSQAIREFQMELLNGNRSRFLICRNCEWY